MKLTLHEIAKVVGAKNDVTAYEDVATASGYSDLLEAFVGNGVPSLH